MKLLLLAVCALAATATHVAANATETAAPTSFPTASPSPAPSPAPTSAPTASPITPGDLELEVAVDQFRYGGFSLFAASTPFLGDDCANKTGISLALNTLKAESNEVFAYHYGAVPQAAGNITYDVFFSGCNNDDSSVGVFVFITTTANDVIDTDDMFANLVAPGAFSSVENALQAENITIPALLLLQHAGEAQNGDVFMLGDIAKNFANSTFVAVDGDAVTVSADQRLRGLRVDMVTDFEEEEEQFQFELDRKRQQNDDPPIVVVAPGVSLDLHVESYYSSMEDLQFAEAIMRFKDLTVFLNGELSDDMFLLSFNNKLRLADANTTFYVPLVTGEQGVVGSVNFDSTFLTPDVIPFGHTLEYSVYKTEVHQPMIVMEFKFVKTLDTQPNADGELKIDLSQLATPTVSLKEVFQLLGDDVKVVEIALPNVADGEVVEISSDVELKQGSTLYFTNVRSNFKVRGAWNQTGGLFLGVNQSAVNRRRKRACGSDENSDVPILIDVDNAVTLANDAFVTVAVDSAGSSSAACEAPEQLTLVQFRSAVSTTGQFGTVVVTPTPVVLDNDPCVRYEQSQSGTSCTTASSLSDDNCITVFMEKRTFTQADCDADSTLCQCLPTEPSAADSPSSDDTTGVTDDAADDMSLVTDDAEAPADGLGPGVLAGIIVAGVLGVVCIVGIIVAAIVMLRKKGGDDDDAATPKDDTEMAGGAKGKLEVEWIDETSSDDDDDDDDGDNSD